MQALLLALPSSILLGVRPIEPNEAYFQIDLHRTVLLSLPSVRKYEENTLTFLNRVILRLSEQTVILKITFFDAGCF